MNPTRYDRDFHKDKGAGELSNFIQWGQNPCVFLPYLSQPLSLNNCCWWLRQLIALGVGWQDYQSSPTHTLYHDFGYSSPHADSPSSPRAAEHPRTAKFSSFLLLCIHGQKWSYFSPHAGPPLLCILT